MSWSVLGVGLFEIVVRLGGLALLAAATTMVVAFVYRARVKARFPDGATILVGLGSVALYLNTRLALVQFLGEDGQALSFPNALLNVATFLAAGVASFAGRRLADETAVSGRISLGRLQPDLSPIVRATGRFITVTIPEEIEDIEGYDPVPEETKQVIAGRRLDFPRGLTVEQLASQLAARLKERHQIGYVDADLQEDGTLEHLAVGRRTVGLGPTLAPGTAAAAVRCDPPFSASPGDSVNIWRPGSVNVEAEWLGRGELRASRDGLATIAVKEQLARQLAMDETYRLMTLSADVNADREFAAMLRRGEETMSIVEVEDTSPLVGTPIRRLELWIVAVETPDGSAHTLPPGKRAIEAGDRLHAIGRPDALRALKAQPGTSVHDPMVAEAGT